MKKLNLCFIIENTTDIRLINGFEMDFSLSIFARRRKDYSVVPWAISKKVKVHLNKCNRFFYPILLFFSLLKHFHSFDILVVNSDTLAGLSVNLVKFFIHKPSISIIQKPTLEYLYAKYLKGNMGLFHYLLQYSVGRFLIAWNVSQFDYNIVVSNYIKNKLSKYSKSEIDVVPFYGIDRVFSPSLKAQKEKIRKKLSLPGDKYIIFVSSRISPEKDISTLFKSIKILIEGGINDIIILNLSGQFNSFVEMAKRFNIEKFVIGRPAISPYDLPSYYQAIDICIQPSLYEGLGLSPLESIACGTPVIVSHSGGLKESTVHKIHALHFKPGEPDDLAKKIKYAYEHRKEMQAMAKIGLERVRDNYSAEEVFKRFKLIAGNLRKYYKEIEPFQNEYYMPVTRSASILGKTKVGMVVNFLPDEKHHGGVSHQVHGLAEEFSKKFNVTVISMNKTNLNCNYKNCSVHFSGLLNKYRFTKILFFPLFIRFQKLNEYDIIHTHGDDFLFFHFKKPIVRTFYGSALGEMRAASSAKRRIHQFFRYFTEFLSGFHARVNVSISKSTKKYLPFVDKIIPCGIDLGKFKPAPEKSESPTILFVGTIEGRKRGWFLVEVFKKEIKKEIPSAELWVVSSEKVGGDGVRWFGRVSEEKLIDLYQKAWVFCLPSKYEGFGVPYIEAMACGTPVVASPNPGAKEVLYDGEYGSIVKDEMIGKTIVRLVRSEDLRNEYILKGLDYVLRYSWDRVIGEYNTLYNRLLNREVR